MIKDQIFRIFWHRSAKENYELIKNMFLEPEPLREFDVQHPSIFVLSTGRVGTQTLCELCGLSKEYSVFHEPQPKLFELGKLYYETPPDASTDVIFKTAFNIARQTIMRNALKKGCGYIETSPQVTFLARIVNDLLPNSRFIHLVRHPKWVIRSGLRRNWFNDPLYDKNRIVPTQRSAINIDWNKASEFDKNVWLWAETNNWILNFERAISRDRFIRLRSEDIFFGSRETLDALYSFMNREVPAITKINKILNKKLNQQKTGDFPEPGNWSDLMDKQLIEIAGDVMGELSYN